MGVPPEARVYWYDESQYNRLFNVTYYKIVQKFYAKGITEVAVRIKSTTVSREPVLGVYTFTLSKTRKGWKVINFYKGYPQLGEKQK
jgi:hypothetical protein